MSKRFLVSASAAALAAVFATSGANAATVTLNHLSGSPATTLIVHYHINGSGATEPEVGQQFTVDTSAGTLLAFCIDIFHRIPSNADLPLAYDLDPITNDFTPPPGPNPLSATVAGEIQTLANIGFRDTKAGTATKNELAALQGAIWDIEYNTNGNSFAAFGSAAVDALIANYVAFATANPASYSLGLSPAAVGTTQAFVVGAPEVSTWAMMVAGFAGLGFAGWRRGTKTPLAA
jgi:hypothetical protein